jgi:4a-hydroxytetrahydrobiopterin dehydratase
VPVERLPEADINKALDTLPGWTLHDGKLRREYRFPDFSHAFGFMAAAATVAEAMNHHPEWVNVYNRVEIALSTHESGGVTSKDLELATKLEVFAQKFQ